jgi:NAD(P)-dependent dehydrogenase (short-subunit alcohol dehydrogenase family)
MHGLKEAKNPMHDDSKATQSPFQTEYRALVIGAGGAIGKAFVNALENDALCTHVQTVSRSDGSGFDLLDRASLATHAAACADYGPYRLIVDATGVLTIDGVGPEKSLAAVQPDVLAKAYAVNAIGPLMVLRHFAPLLLPGPSIYAKLSARVGSIADNYKGGWYGYRASKAALNMMLQTAAIELQRRQPELRIVALQPGTVRSELSKPFSATVPNLLEPAQSVAGMLATLQALDTRQGAHFVDHHGHVIPW